MFINNLSKRERYLTLITLSIVLLAVIYAFIVTPIIAAWKNLNSQIQSKINALEKDSRILANKQALASEYAKLSRQAKSAKSGEQAVADTLAYIENTARNNSCFIVNIKPIGIKDIESYKEIQIEVAAEAPIQQFSKFLYDIENPRDTLMDIKRFTLSSKYGQTGTLKGSFLISKILLD